MKKRAQSGDLRVFRMFVQSVCHALAYVQKNRSVWGCAFILAALGFAECTLEARALGVEGAHTAKHHV